MSNLPDRLNLEHNESMLFCWESTYKTDYSYKDGEIYPLPKTEYKGFGDVCQEREDHVRHKPPPVYKPLKDTHAMTAYRDANVPFTLFWDLDPILRKPFKNIEKSSVQDQRCEIEREQAQRTRPRVLLQPADPIDDIEDKRARKRFVDDMYTTEKERGLRQSVPVYFNVKSPYPGTNAPPQPKTLPVHRPGLVSPEWRMESVKRYSEQISGFHDSTKDFWMKFPLYDCRACDETKKAIDYRKRKSKIKLPDHIRI